MDRDASAPPLKPADAVPPYPPDFVRKVGLVGVGLNAAAAVLAVVASMSAPPPAFLTPVQVVLVFLGVVTAGSALSMRADLWWVWGLFGVASLLGSVGLPTSWDSFQTVLIVAATIGAVGAVFCLSSPGWRLAIMTVCVMFHFSGIFAATTSPPPQPWIVEQAWTRAYNPYLNFIYMRNAYHFYSPDPGPASILVGFLKTEKGTDANGNKQYETRWVVMPTRPADLKDPLGLGYFRRLSLTEQVARPGNGLADQSERAEIVARRTGVASAIPFHPVFSPETQYRLPESSVIRYVLPSYASHIILEETPDKETAAKTTVKVYRLEHATTPVEQFRLKLPDGTYPNPYHPGTFRPYFLGEFDAHGNLLNPQDPLLYWMLPVLPQQVPVGSTEGKGKGYFDYLSVHALESSRDEVFNADEDAGQVFPWKKLSNRK
ncbi:MAG: hypothetical protein C0467_10740 [Planctomycetaceae bacterium]|nr:hypothetical protein [Planctomycetaceae bacterium]